MIIVSHNKEEIPYAIIDFYLEETKKRHIGKINGEQIKIEIKFALTEGVLEGLSDPFESEIKYKRTHKEVLDELELVM